MVTTKQYDLLNRLTNSSSSVTFVYAYNSANQRTRATLADGSYWVYTYDSLGQVISGKRYWSDGTPVAGQQFEYTFDDIGNRRSAGSGGDQYGAALHYGSYWANSLNQYTSRDVPGYVNVVGSAKTNATVSLWTADGYWAQTSRKADYFRGELALNNATGALWLTITNLAVLNNGTNQDIVTNTVGNAFVARTPEAFGYDADGNLTSNGRFTITWDAENRALSFASLSNSPSASKIKVDCTYDWLGRRTQKIVSTWNGSAYVPQSTNRFVYDGWNLIATLNSDFTLHNWFIWGLDLSGSPQGAGGVGGLLAIGDSTQGTHFAAFDGNGNVATLVKASDGTVSAQYEYGPFGEVIRATGPMAKVNPCRFSTKYLDDETDLLYYGLRYYNPGAGRWLSRDAIEEEGSVNLYGFVLNAPLNFVDDNGLIEIQASVLGFNYSYDGPDTGYTLGLEWVLGIGTDRTYGPNDPLTKQLQSSRVVEIDREKVRQLLKAFCKTSGGSIPANIPIGGELGQIPPAQYALWQFPKDLILNPGAAFIGSITSGRITIHSISCCKCEAKIHAHAENVSGTASATHKKPSGGRYAQGRASSLLPDNIFGQKGPMHTFKQIFDWDETLSFCK